MTTSMSPAEPQIASRRDRLRALTQDEIQQHALAQIDAEGAHALSLTAIAKAMGMSGPALYRYFPSRDALVAQLVTVIYGQLVDALRDAAKTPRKGPAGRFRAVAHAYRLWAKEHPRRYAMLFGDRPEDVPDTEDALATIDQGMDVLIDALAEARDPATSAPPASGTKLDRQLRRWAARHARSDVPTDTLRIAVLTWTRLHGIAALELAGVFDDMDLGAEELIDAEISSSLRS